LKEKKATLSEEKPFDPQEVYFVVFLVDAKHLDYTNVETLLDTIAKHPDGSTSRDVGHAWMIVSGMVNGKRVIIEGGHSGERGIQEMRYLDKVFLAQDTSDPDPARYFFRALQDGYFEQGSGGHVPTYAVRLPITPEVFSQIYWLVQPGHYHFQEYSLTQSQCCTFITKVASLCGIDLEDHISIDIPQIISVNGCNRTLWTDPTYSSILIASPDVLEKKLLQAVKEGKASVALRWYKKEFSRTKGYMSTRCRIE
jgi:hypothetical protein